MQKSIVLKAVVFCLVSCLTWIATNAIQAQGDKKRPVAATTAYQGGLKEGLTVAELPNLTQSAFPTHASMFHPKIASKFHLKDESLEVTGNNALIHASVDLMSRYRSRQYIWYLQVRNMDTGQIIVDMPYLHQVFSVPSSGVMNPQFDEVLTLPPGNYQSVLTMNKLPDGVEIQSLPENVQKAMFAMITVSKTFRIL